MRVGRVSAVWVDEQGEGRLVERLALERDGAAYDVASLAEAWRVDPDAALPGLRERSSGELAQRAWTTGALGSFDARLVAGERPEVSLLPAWSYSWLSPVDPERSQVFVWHESAAERAPLGAWWVAPRASVMGPDAPSDDLAASHPALGFALRAAGASSGALERVAAVCLAALRTRPPAPVGSTTWLAAAQLGPWLTSLDEALRSGSLALKLGGARADLSAHGLAHALEARLPRLGPHADEGDVAIVPLAQLGAELSPTLLSAAALLEGRGLGKLPLRGRDRARLAPP